MRKRLIWTCMLLAIMVGGPGRFAALRAGGSEEERAAEGEDKSPFP